MADLLTPRLRLRRWRPGDAAPMAAINSDPEVARYLNRPADPRAVAAFHRAVLDHWARYGFGWFALESREPALAGRLLGFAGVAHPSFLPEIATRPELGWRLGREAWGRGLATEAAQATRDHAFAVLGLPELIAIIHPDNERSRRVATKLGMTVERLIENPALGRPVELWQMAPPRCLTETRGGRPMTARVWKGVVRSTDADVYADYIRETGFAEYAETAGNRGAWLLRRDEGDRTEFITLSLWDSTDAIKAFAGDDIEAAVLYPEDERYLLGDSTVTHYEVADHVSP